ncbi:hypothetical protein F5887DRAFT_891652 [Amanita rubescens]|nr:hypothetical protein F5887DRAFT_891652 [Amanita rubescens]
MIWTNWTSFLQSSTRSIPVCGCTRILPQQHPLTHYRNLNTEFGALNGLCSSIAESQLIEGVKGPYRRGNQNEP